MYCHLLQLRAQHLMQAFLLTAALSAATVRAEEPASPTALWKKLEPFAQPPEEFAGKPPEIGARSAGDRREVQ